MMLAEMNIYSYLLFYLSACTLDWSLSLINFTFWNTKHIGRFMGLNKQYFSLIKIINNNPKDRRIRITIINKFKYFMRL